MWAELAALVNANTTETLLIAIIGTILVWMYKQFKSMIDREQQDKLTTVQLKQSLFTKLELSIASVLHLNNEESKQKMYALLGECAPYLTSMQRTVMRDYYKSFDQMLLYSLQALTVNEVDKLGRELDKMLEYKDNGEWLNYMMRLYAPFWPTLLFCVLALYIFFIFMLVRREMGKQGVKRWVAIALVVFSPTLIFVFGRIDISIFVIVIQASTFAFLVLGKRPSEIIRP